MFRQSFIRRCMSTVAEASHAPPKKTNGIMGRYAGSLFTAASKAKLLPKVEEELQAFNSVLKKSPAFALFLKNPTVPRGEKAKAMSSLLDDKFSDLTRNLFVTLAANGRIAQSEKVITEFLDLMETASGVVKAVVTTAEPLGGKALKSVQTGVLEMVEKGKKVELELKVDPAIIGGLQVAIGDRFLDLSVASRIATLGKALEGAEA